MVLGICPGDGSIHLAFDHHKDPLNYRVSLPGVATDPASVDWSTALFGDVTDRLEPLGRLTDVTYPTFIPAPNGNLLFYYRFGGSGSGDGMIQEYDAATGQWTTGLGKFIRRTGSYSGVLSTNSTSRNPYINGISYSGNRLHASWGWRENSGGAQYNHDLNYAYSDNHGRTWRNSAGSLIGTTGSSFISVNSPGLVVAPIPQNSGLSNSYTHYAYPDGSCHVMVSHKPSGGSGRRYHHYWRDAQGNWSGEALPFDGSRPKLVGDDNRELFLVHEDNELLKVAKGSPIPAGGGWNWSIIHSQTGRSEGGEGQIDVDRWEAERVLSVYGQEDPPSNGASTPISVFDYQVSSKAILPLPMDGEIEVNAAPSLQWTAGIGAVSHRIYLGIDQEGVANADTSSPQYRGEQNPTIFSPGFALARNTTFYWRVDEVDADSEIHKGLVWSFTTGGDFLSCEATDAGVMENGGVTSTDTSTSLLGAGGTSPWVDRCTVYVFQLPNLGDAGNPFDSASFEFGFRSKQNTLRNNDLYGLGRRSSPNVLGSDYYGQTSEADPSNATRLQTDILTNSTPLGRVQTSGAGGSALLDYLNAQYDSGAGIGKYVFLRLNTSQSKDGIRRATLSMSEDNAVSAVQPRILYSAGLGPVVTMVALGSPEGPADGHTWSDGLPAHAGSHYVVPENGNLRSEGGTSTFPGLSLTVEKGGRFQIRSLEGSAELTTIKDLVLNGGASFAPGDFAQLNAGSGTSATNVLDGVITHSGFSRFLSYGTVNGSAILRNLKVLSRIEGSGRIQAMEGSAAGLSKVTISHPGNTFSGVWEVAEGSSLCFEDAGAVGTADIDVRAGGRLEIDGHWSANASLIVADAPETTVDLSDHAWVVSSLAYGAGLIPGGTYRASELNAFGLHSSFTGTGTLTVTLGGNGGPVARWALDEGTGGTAVDSSGHGHSGILRNGVTWDSDAIRGTFASFDGSDDRITTPFTYALSSSDDFTWTWWAKPSATNHPTAIMLGNRFPENSDGVRFKFIKLIVAQSSFANAGEVGQIERVLYPEITSGQWHHYAMVKDGNGYQWYVDGVAQGDPTTLSYSENFPIPLHIGGDDDGTGRPNEHFEGGIDDVVLYGRALTPVEVARVREGAYSDLPATWQEAWRETHFGTTGNSGLAADTFDANLDGEDNLLEFATGQDPLTATRALTTVEADNGNLVFRYIRSKGAVADGIVFQPRWSDTLETGSWSGVGITDEPDPDLEDTPELQFRKVTLPAGSVGKRFCQLLVSTN